VEGLGINIPLIIAQVINFFILLGLLYLVAYKPVLRMFNERANRIKESMEQTEQIKHSAEHAEEEVKKRLAEAGREGQELISKAARTGEEIRKKALEDAKPFSPRCGRISNASAMMQLRNCARSSRT
jgi:F-type H+-transporting ATPase subunit b